MMRQRRGSINFCRRGKEIGGGTEIGGGRKLAGERKLAAGRTLQEPGAGSGRTGAKLR